MLLARRAVRDGENAFSTAFKREIGESPLRYRSRTARPASGQRDHLGAGAPVDLDLGRLGR